MTSLCNVPFSIKNMNINFFLGGAACKSSPCGRNALCQDSLDGSYACVCVEGYTGDPFRGCQGNY